MVLREDILKTIEFEGGYVNQESDPGGETKYGITKRFYPTLDIADLTIDDAVEIYEREYARGVILRSKRRSVSFLLFEAKVTGHVELIEAIQAFCCAVFKLPATFVDGKIGPATVNALNDMNGADVDNMLRSLTDMSWFIGIQVNNRIGRKNLRLGAPQGDYRKGLINRNIKRCAYAQELRRKENG